MDRDSRSDLQVAWKPSGVSMKRPVGGGQSAFEKWASNVISDGKPGCFVRAGPILGRGIGSLVFVSQNVDVLRSAEAALTQGVAQATISAVVQGEPCITTILKAKQDYGFDVDVTYASEGLRYGRLSIVEVSSSSGLLPEKNVRRALAALEHPVVGNGENCARDAGVSKTFLAVTRLIHSGLDVVKPCPPSFWRFLSNDATRLHKLGVSECWTGRTEHKNERTCFDSLTLKVPTGVFVPRLSALRVVEAVSGLPLPSDCRILDAGTGSGCIFLALLNRLPHAVGVGIDADTAAVNAANANLEALGFSGRGQIRHAKFSQIGSLADEGCANFQVAVSNPPYLPQRVVRHLRFARELQSQSIDAFAAGEDGQQGYAELAEVLRFPGVLSPRGWVVMGCQPGRSAWAAEPFQANGSFELHEEGEEYVVLRLK